MTYLTKGFYFYLVKTEKGEIVHYEKTYLVVNLRFFFQYAQI